MSLEPASGPYQGVYCADLVYAVVDRRTGYHICDALGRAFQCESWTEARALAATYNDAWRREQANVETYCRSGRR